MALHIYILIYILKLHYDPRCFDVEIIIGKFGEKFNRAKRSTRSKYIEGPGWKDINSCFVSPPSAFTSPNKLHLNTETIPLFGTILINIIHSSGCIFFSAPILDLPFLHFMWFPFLLSQKKPCMSHIQWLYSHSGHRDWSTGEHITKMEPVRPL